MRVVHISTNGNGGAAKAAIRLHLALKLIGVSSTMVFLHNLPESLQDAYLIPDRIPFHLRVLRRLGLYKFYQDRIDEVKKKIENSFEYISLPYSDYNLEAFSFIRNADIINLHWPPGFIDNKRFFKTFANKKIVWTVHDMNPFSGIFHYSDDLYKNSANIQILETDSFIRKKKLSALEQVKDFKFVCPSLWMISQIEFAKEFSSFRKIHIPYCLDAGIFCIGNKQAQRSILSLPQDKTIFLFVSEDVHNHRKGFDILVEAITKINRSDIVLCAVGKPLSAQVQTGGIPIYYLGSISEEAKMAQIYSACDCFVLPSRQDNLPNVMLEALACGLPVISFKSGGMADVIVNGENGLIADHSSTEELLKMIDTFMLIKGDFDSQLISAKAQLLFDMRKIATRYVAEAYC